MGGKQLAYIRVMGELLQHQVHGDARPLDKTGFPAKIRGFATIRSRQRLDLIALQSGYESQETSLYRAILGQYPGFSIGFGAARDTSNISTRGGNLSLDIPIFNRNHGSIGVAAATREQLYRECQPFASNPGRDRYLSR
jgi:hypothetical protein